MGLGYKIHLYQYKSVAFVANKSNKIKVPFTVKMECSKGRSELHKRGIIYLTERIIL